METMMSSNEDIINVVNRLQMMEASFSKILMEAAMKMAALTDANIFLLVETGEGRRFAGKQHLCDSFMNEGLITLPNDVQYELDETNPTALIEKPTFLNAGNLLSNAPTIYHQAAQMAASSSALGGVPWNNGTGNGVASAAVSPPKPPQLIRKRPASSGMRQGAAKQARSRSSINSPAVIVEGAGESSSPATGKQFVRVKTEMNEDGTPVKSTRDLLKEVNKTHGTSDGTVAQWDPNNSLALPEDYDGQLMASDWNLGEFLSQNAKVQALKNITDDSSFTDRDSPIFKLLNSALYDMAKIAAVHCPVKSTKNAHSAVFFVNAFDLFWESMPNMQQMSERGALCTDSGKNSGLKSYCRNRMQRNFNSLIIRMK